MSHVHYTFFLEASTTARPDLRGRFRFTVVEITIDGELVQVPEPNLAFLPTGSTLGFSFVDSTGDLGRVLTPAGFFALPGSIQCAIHTVEGTPYVDGLPGIDAFATVAMAASQPNGPLSGTLTPPEGLPLTVPPEELFFPDWKFNPVVRLTLPGSSGPERVFVLDRPATVRYARASPSFPSAAEDQTGVPFP